MSDLCPDAICRQFAAAVDSLQRAVTFRAWRNSRPVESPLLNTFTTFEEVADAFTPGAIFRAGEMVLSVLREDAGRNEKEVRFYGFKQEGQRRFRRDPVTGVPVATRRIYPVLLHAMRVDAFEPVQPFDALRDCPVGCDLTLVEG